LAEPTIISTRLAAPVYIGPRLLRERSTPSCFSLR
jgi:hypothetical protein